jgi:TPR repeat protein
MKKVISIMAIFLLVSLGASPSYNRGIKQYQSKDYEDALKSFYVSARHNNFNAYYMLGKMHEEGIGTAINYQTAFYWYEKSANRNHPSAQYRLARMYEGGKGIIKKPKKAKFWYKRAASQGNKEAKDRLANWDKKINTDSTKPTKEKSILETILPSAVDETISHKQTFADKEASTPKVPSAESDNNETIEDDNSSIIDMLMFWK